MVEKSKKARFREENNNWRGGRSLASNGYILIRVGTDHHLADVRGYAYEHRVVAEEKYGRRLQDGEHVHHINGDKSDNRPDNLEICNSATHRYLHRKRDSGRKNPCESNELVLCACGCGAAFYKFDQHGRPRKYVSGHNTPKRGSRIGKN